MLKDDTDLQVVAEKGGYTLRLARAADREAVTALCARAWPHGRDYVPAEWDGWLAERSGATLVAGMQGNLAAVARVSFQSPHEAWLHGLRVDPDHRRRGLANWMLASCLDLARARGASVARLATGSSNVAVQRTTSHQGMECAAELLQYRAPPDPRASTPLVLSSADLARAWRLLDESAALRATRGLYETYWCWQELTTERLAGALQAGAVVGTADAGGDLQALALVGQPESPGPMVTGLLVGGAAAVSRLSKGLLGLAARSGALEVHANLPAVRPLRQAVEAAGFEPDREMVIRIFEKRL